MQELIDRKAALKKMCETCGYCERSEKAMRSTHPEFVADKCNNYKFLAELPTVEPEVQHGRWIPTEYDSYADGAPVWDKFECSECGHEHKGEEDTLTAFCPDCGAQMDKKELTKMPKPIDMPELIDKKALLEILCFGCTKYRGGICSKENGRCTEYTIIKLMTTIEAEPVRHGRWIETRYCPVGDTMYCDCNCSICNFEITKERGFYPRFCENCGTRMDLRTPTEVQLDEADSVMMGEVEE